MAAEGSFWHGKYRLQGMPTQQRHYCAHFMALFPNQEACYLYLAKLKKQMGYRCLKCEHAHYSKGRTRHHRRCKSCGYDESPTVATWFAGMHLPIHKTFYLLYKLHTGARRMSGQQLSELIGLQPKTVRRLRKLAAEAKMRARISGITLSGEYDFLQNVLL